MTPAAFDGVGQIGRKRRQSPRCAVISGGNLAEERRGMAGEEVKKIAQRLNVGAALTTNMCGSGNPSPTAIFGASAHPPQAPIWL